MKRVVGVIGLSFGLMACDANESYNRCLGYADRNFTTTSEKMTALKECGKLIETPVPQVSTGE